MEDNFVYIKNEKQFSVRKNDVWDDSYKNRKRNIRIKRTLETY